MTILIHTIPADSHAVAVQLALKNMGVPVQTWFTGDYPSRQLSAFRFDGRKQSDFEIVDDAESINSATAFDVVWHRRVPMPQKPMPIVEEMDRDFVSSQTRHFMASAVPLVGKGAFWVNDFNNSRYADNKIVQLQAALDVGLDIPETIVTNDPDKLRHFIRTCAPRKVIYKPLRAYAWRDAETQRVTYTSLVSEVDLPEDELIRACPGIYQEYFEKAFEVRVTVMGKHVVSAALKAADELDWRVSIIKGEIKARAHELPEELKHKCVALLRELGLVFGCMDFIVTPDGRYIFLENNEAGQFIWIEQMVPELLVLDPFVHFLLERDPDFNYVRLAYPVTYGSVASTRQHEELRLQFDRHSMTEPT